MIYYKNYVVGIYRQYTYSLCLYFSKPLNGQAYGFKKTLITYVLKRTFYITRGNFQNVGICIDILPVYLFHTAEILNSG